MPFVLHSVQQPDQWGSTPWTDRLFVGVQFSVANLAGSGAGATVALNLTFPSSDMTPNYSVFCSPSQACFWSISNKTASGFTLTLSPPSSSATLASGTVDLLVVG